MHVIIIGCGIAGLASAIGLTKAGHHVTILERALVLRESGGGLALSPNANRALEALGVLPQIHKHANHPIYAAVRSYDTLEVVSKHPLADLISDIYGHPYILIHRRDLHATLHSEALRLGVRVLLSHGLKSIDTKVASVMVENGSVITGDLIIGADGERSLCREAVLGRHIPSKDSGDQIYCVTIPASKVREAPDFAHLVDPPCVTLVLGPSGHGVTYALERDGLLYMLLIVKHSGTEDPPTLPRRVTLEKVKEAFRGWHMVEGLIDSALECIQWTLLETDMPETWTKDKVVLVGDAAHAMLPFLAQGAAMALEDAVALSSLLSRIPSTSPNPRLSDLDGLLQEFFQLRFPRVNALKLRTRQLREVYALSSEDDTEKGNGGNVEGNRSDIIRAKGSKTLFSDVGFSDFLFVYDAAEVRVD